MKKRGSLNLSINAIVVLILAITMLGLGLAFMRNIFGGATEEFSKVSGEVEKQMIEQMKDTSQVVSLSRPVVDIKIGEREQIFIGLKNDQQDIGTFEIRDFDCNAIGTDGLLSCYNGGEVIYEYLEGPINIVSGEVRVLPINIKVSTQANDGTCYCIITINANGEDRTTELTIDVTV